MGRKSNNKKCKVCESPKAISQFGAMACRACGAFFRRLVLSNRKYKCDCDVRLKGMVESSSARKLRISNCRACRMRGCIEADMKIELVKKSEKRRLIKIQNKISIFDENAKCPIFLKKLLDIGVRANAVLLNVIGFPNCFIDQFETFEELIQSKDNLLAHAEFYKNQPSKFFDMEKFEINVAKYGVFHTEPLSLNKILLITINIAKILPAFSRLNQNDQIVAVSNFAQAANFLIGRFNSMKLNSQTDLMEIIDYPFIKLYTSPTNSNEPVIKNLAEAIFGTPMKNFLQIAPSREEFVLILALLFSNSTISSLSKHGQGIMNEETEKCSKILLRFQQMKFGEQKGALRYAECLQLFWNIIYTTQKHKELLVYIDTISQQGTFSAVMPKILRPLMM